MKVRDKQRNHYDILYGGPEKLGWGSPSASYENYRYSVWVRNCFREIVREKGKELSMLDIGCGDGKKLLLLGKEFLDYGAKLFGLDISIPALKKAMEKRKRYQGKLMSFLIGDGEEVPIKTDSLDAVLCVEVLEHISSPERTLREIHRVLAPGGFVLIGTPNKSYVFERIGMLLPQGVQTKLKGREPRAKEGSEEWGDMHPSEMGWGELKGILKRTGFQIRTVRGTNLISQKNWLDASPFLFGLSVIADSLLNLLRLRPNFQWGVILLARALK